MATSSSSIGKRAEALLAEHGNTWFPKHPDQRFPVTLGMIQSRGLPDYLNLFSDTKDPLGLLAWFTARYPLRSLTILTKTPRRSSTRWKPADTSRG